MSGPVVAGVAETNGDTTDRQLHRLGSDLTQDRVGAGPESVIANSTVSRPSFSSRASAIALCSTSPRIAEATPLPRRAKTQSEPIQGAADYSRIKPRDALKDALSARISYPMQNYLLDGLSQIARSVRDRVDLNAHSPG
jgi:hypothetical protein